MKHTSISGRYWPYEGAAGRTEIQERDPTADQDHRQQGEHQGVVGFDDGAVKPEHMGQYKAGHRQKQIQQEHQRAAKPQPAENEFPEWIETGFGRVGGVRFHGKTSFDFSPAKGHSPLF